ncbi:epoxide hydrolase A-like [Macadamia integrifolia]|uniref:epoxide hydrolase A-like n=1 Tax=Macadamia integrifolia TaxID=60698 RepID=UPI001C4FA1FE|nr:epoxide hydrolase A-like [Macadamia integrifolia]XP_042512780.1 epoxide hydrolase A-like [Macadamia integrifolia]
MEGIEHGMVSVNGINMHIAEKGEGPVVLLLHGFPELWYSWRHQISALASHSYRAVAPDLRGFGDTDTPPSTTSYTAFHVVGDLIALIDLLGQDQIHGREGFHVFVEMIGVRFAASYPNSGGGMMEDLGW